MSRPWLSIAASVKRSASAPKRSTSPSGSRYCLRLDIFWPCRRGPGRADRAFPRRCPRNSSPASPSGVPEDNMSKPEMRRPWGMALELFGFVGPASVRTATGERTRCRALLVLAQRAVTGFTPGFLFGLATKILPSSSNQAGIRWPHQAGSTRTRLDVLEPVEPVFFHVSGTILIAPARVASSTGAASFAASTTIVGHHGFDPTPERRSVRLRDHPSSTFSSAPSASSIVTTRSRASKRSSPTSSLGSARRRSHSRPRHRHVEHRGWLEAGALRPRVVEIMPRVILTRAASSDRHARRRSPAQPPGDRHLHCLPTIAV